MKAVHTLRDEMHDCVTRICSISCWPSPHFDDISLPIRFQVELQVHAQPIKPGYHLVVLRIPWPKAGLTSPSGVKTKGPEFHLVQSQFIPTSPSPPCNFAQFPRPINVMSRYRAAPQGIPASRSSHESRVLEIPRCTGGLLALCILDC
jgi:hypothetical protein